MGKVHGYIELSPSVVVDACEKYLADRERRQAIAKQAYIDRQMNRRWFPAKTPEQAEKRAWDMVFCEYHIGGSYWGALARSILAQSKTAEAQGVKIFISDDVHDCIGKFIDAAKPAVDVEALKKPDPVFYKTDSDYVRGHRRGEQVGWNDCIDNLADRGLLQPTGDHIADAGKVIEPDFKGLEKILRGMRARNEQGSLELTNWIADNLTRKGE